MSHRIAVFNAGRIEQVGAPAEVYERPATAFVAGFVGTSNLLAGAVGRGDPRARGHVHRAAREDPARGRRGRSRSTRRSPTIRTPRPAGSGASSTSAPTRATTSRSTPAASSWSPSRTWRRPRPRSSPSRGALSASSGNGSTPGRSPRRRARRPGSGGGAPSHAQIHPDPGGHRRPGRIRLFELGGTASPAASAAASSGAERRRPPRPRASPRPRAHPRRRARRPATPPGDYGTIKPLKPAVDLSTVGGPGEGALNIIIWGGYAESGQNVPEYDWVTAFQAETGCKVNTKVGNTSDEMVTLMRQGGTYDGVSASGDATLRLIANGDVAAIDPATIPGFGDVAPFLQNAPHYVVDGKHYGTPHGWGGNTLLYRIGLGDAGPDELERRVRPDRGDAVRGQDHGLRQPDLHRRRGPVPQGPQPGARDHRSVRADPAAVRRGGRPAQAAAPVGRQVLVRLLRRDRQLHQRHHHRRHDVAVPVQRARRRPASRSARSSRPRA